jgi:hypothetical protein
VATVLALAIVLFTIGTCFVCAQKNASADTVSDQKNSSIDDAASQDDSELEASSVWDSSEPETIKVGFFAFEGYHEMDENGIKSGYGYDFLRLTQKYVNLNYEYVGYDKSWGEMQQMLLDGEIDMVTSAHKTQARLEKYDFSLPIG